MADDPYLKALTTEAQNQQLVKAMRDATNGSALSIAAQDREFLKSLQDATGGLTMATQTRQLLESTHHMRGFQESLQGQVFGAFSQYRDFMQSMDLRRVAHGAMAAIDAGKAIRDALVTFNPGKAVQDAIESLNTSGILRGLLMHRCLSGISSGHRLTLTSRSKLAKPLMLSTRYPAGL